MDHCFFEGVVGVENLIEMRLGKAVSDEFAEVAELYPLLQFLRPDMNHHEHTEKARAAVLYIGQVDNEGPGIIACKDGLELEPNLLNWRSGGEFFNRRKSGNRDVSRFFYR